MDKSKNVKYFQVAQGVWGMKIGFVNVFVIANRRGVAKGWVLVDTGVKGSAKRIIAMAESIFGPGTKPAAIVLTHGHFDHVGSLEALLTYWDVPVYAHPLEIPYLNGSSSYPPADPTIGGGLMSLLSFLYPRKPVDLIGKLRSIDMQDCIAELPEWRCIHTPGHTPGHISLFLPLNATLIAGDAFVTTKAESAIYALRAIKKLSGPPKYFTTDWDAAEQSVKKLMALEPRMAATGHGPVMRGKELQSNLQHLAEHFKEIAVPKGGRYTGHPALADEQGVEYVPAPVLGVNGTIAVAIAALVAGFITVRLFQKRLTS